MDHLLVHHGITWKAPGLRNDPALNQAAAIQQDQVIHHQNDSCLDTSSRQKGCSTTLHMVTST